MRKRRTRRPWTQQPAAGTLYSFAKAEDPMTARKMKGKKKAALKRRSIRDVKKVWSIEEVQKKIGEGTSETLGEFRKKLKW
jgi:hypothetical protein